MLHNGLFADQQDGFIPKGSCMTQLLCILENWTKLLESIKCIETILLDFQKAFDSVPLERLLSKLEAYGITSKTLNWVQSCLTNRPHRVFVENGKSECANVRSGIP